MIMNRPKNVVDVLIALSILSYVNKAIEPCGYVKIKPRITQGSVSATPTVEVNINALQKFKSRGVLYNQGRVSTSQS
jgi:hypothetical protein